MQSTQLGKKTPEWWWQRMGEWLEHVDEGERINQRKVEWVGLGPRRRSTLPHGVESDPECGVTPVTAPETSPARNMSRIRYSVGLT